MGVIMMDPEIETARESRNLDDYRNDLRVRQLVSITEGANLCPGFQLQGCGDEVDKPGDICPSCRREEDKFYQEQLWRADGVEPLVAYPHLTDNGE